MQGKFRGDIETLAQHIAMTIVGRFGIKPTGVRFGGFLGTGWPFILDPEIVGTNIVKARIAFSELFGIGRTGVEGHAGEVVLVDINGEPGIFFNGRRHSYEGRWDDMKPIIALLFEVLRALCKGPGARFINTNAGGYYDQAFKVGDVMVARELNDASVSVSPTDASNGFYYASDCLHPYLVQSVQRAAADLPGITVHAGTLKWTPGPFLGDMSVTREMRIAGVNAVGMTGWDGCCYMSAAKMPAVQLTLLTDPAGVHSTHERHLAVGRNLVHQLFALLRGIVEVWQREDQGNGFHPLTVPFVDRKRELERFYASHPVPEELLNDPTITNDDTKDPWVLKMLSAAL